MECISCYSKKVIRYGFYKTYLKYKCKHCGRQFSERSFSFFFRCRFPEEVIRNSILYILFVSTRIASYMIKETINFKVSHVSIFNWMYKFSSLISKYNRSIDFSNIWHVDEKFIKVKDNVKDKKGRIKFSYLWVVIDDKNNIIAVYVSHKRDIISAKKVLQLALSRANKPPEILVSDGCTSYIKACKSVFGRNTRHIVRHFKSEGLVHNKRILYLSNNRIESLNSKINLWYKKFRGFKSLFTANLWCNLWMYFYNIIRPRTTEHEIISINEIIR